MRWIYTEVGRWSGVGFGHVVPQSAVVRAVMRCVLAVALLVGVMIVMASLASATAEQDSSGPTGDAADAAVESS